MTDAPKEIWLQVLGCVDRDGNFEDHKGPRHRDGAIVYPATWSDKPELGGDVRYLRADKVLEDMRKLYKKLDGFRDLVACHGPQFSSQGINDLLTDIAREYPEVKGEEMKKHTKKQTKKLTKSEQRNAAIAEVMPLVGALVKKHGLNIVVAVVNRHKAAAQNKRKIRELEKELAELKGE